MHFSNSFSNYIEFYSCNHFNNQLLTIDYYTLHNYIRSKLETTRVKSVFYTIYLHKLLYSNSNNKESNHCTFISYISSPHNINPYTYNITTTTTTIDDPLGSRFPIRNPRIQKAKDCTWSRFGPWSTCSKPCGAGTQRRQRTIAVKADPDGGKPCRIDGASEIRLCNRQPCGAGLNRHLDLFY